MDPMHKDKPLLSVRIKISRDQFVNAHVYKDDTAQTVADRVFRHANFPPSSLNRDKRRLLAELIEN